MGTKEIKQLLLNKLFTQLKPNTTQHKHKHKQHPAATTQSGASSKSQKGNWSSQASLYVLTEWLPTAVEEHTGESSGTWSAGNHSTGKTHTSLHTVGDVSSIKQFI